MKNLIQGVPLIVQEPNWCGYCCLAMVLQYWGYQLTQDALFNHILVNVGVMENMTMKLKSV